MALGIVNILASGNTTSATSVIITIPSNIARSSLLVLGLAYDKAGGGGADPYSSVGVGDSGVDSLGNTWTSQAAALRDPGAASAGVAFRIFTTRSDAAQITAGTTVQINFGNSSTVAKAYTLTEVTASAGSTAEFNSGNAVASTVSTATAVTITSTAMTTGQAIVGVMGAEAGITQTCTADSDTLNGNWSTQQFAKSGTTTSGMVCASQGKVVTGNGAQTYNITLGIASDYCVGYVIVDQVLVPSPTPSVTPSPEILVYKGGTLKRYNGSQWVPVPKAALKRYTGTQWEVVTYKKFKIFVDGEWKYIDLL